MARSAIKAASETDVTAAGDKTMDFDDGIQRGEPYVIYFPEDVVSVESL